MQYAVQCHQHAGGGAPDVVALPGHGPVFTHDAAHLNAVALVVALVLSRIGSIGTLHWSMPPSANLALRELGIVLFLSVVGLKSGGQFIDTLLQGPGASWLLYGMLITLLPLLIVGCIARAFGHTNYLTLCGLLAGSMTDPPALAFANAMHPSSGSTCQVQWV